MAKLGSEKRPIVVRVHTDDKARYVAETCAKHGWHYIIGFELDKPEDISDLEKMLNPPKPVMSDKIGRNDPCPCGSGKKYKKCCQEKTPSSLPTYSWAEKNGVHSLIPGTASSSEQLENMTKVYQKNIRNSPIWDEMVKQYGKEKAEKLLKEFRVKIE